jgi:hypothetical protein
LVDRADVVKGSRLAVSIDLEGIVLEGEHTQRSFVFETSKAKVRVPTGQKR